MLKKLKLTCKKISSSFFGWIILWPFSYIIQRDQKKYVIIGRDGGKFLDNSKYCFIGLQYFQSLHNINVVFLTDYPDVRAELETHGYQVARLSGPVGWWQFLRCGTIIMDSAEWGSFGRFAAARGARLVQLWHGIPLKQIELLIIQKIASTLPFNLSRAFYAYRNFIGRHRQVDLLVSTSAHVTNKAMKFCFNAKHWPAIGYPRNDVLLDEQLRHHPLVSLGMDDQAICAIRSAKYSGKNVILYTPTFRRNMHDPFSDGVINLDQLYNFLKLHNLFFLIKLHPLMPQTIEPSYWKDNIFFIRPDSDIYPLMHEINILITDYSSIFFDYLLLDRPIVFYCHDLNEYIQDDRGFIFDYETMTPGPKVHSQKDLENQIIGILQRKDIWTDDRRRVRDLVFDHIDGSATKRLMAVLIGK
ncbi:CDP-glycerol:poly(glycerophosphate)glycerophosphotransferase [Desulfobulbus propionicus DSM 2032]|jgi:CDP-glycerol glycerophosphotransferase (TagB/SpsB family)|uniref:CDP-glycerol:poly(Glycerophosphate)glycerophosphotransferase n=1 Tax=Desulfobulbus propionicus (strain ATCC 33891 / DSM 2032 / VKM B-1956 / 1pr3) TaxID=577650 RepID=A0A7U3YN04_DESPD|nr:CDP-glycerol glycerophosphotransferase family protein [Desulfobulbus propionicus]ADW18233.1 CDP-glycerol:poly(glycerophosphate)glycerophosphotransferase [Desulfobulbus propionicus DSM 2032]